MVGFAQIFSRGLRAGPCVRRRLRARHRAERRRARTFRPPPRRQVPDAGPSSGCGALLRRAPSRCARGCFPRSRPAVFRRARRVRTGRFAASFPAGCEKNRKYFADSKKPPYLCTRNRKMIDASLAQLVEHDTLNVGVQGSSPWGGTKKTIAASLAQLVEHDTLNVGVQGSSPWGGTKRESEGSRFFRRMPLRCGAPFLGICRKRRNFGRTSRRRAARKCAVAPAGRL